MITTGRPASLAPRGMVTSPHALASAAGAAMLRAGGSAVDAAIATSATLTVVYPHMTSIGGDAFWLIHDAAANRVRYLDGAGIAAASGTIDAFRARGLDEVPYRGALPGTLTTPGAVASWCEAHAAYGRLPLAQVLAPAAAYAREGFPVTARVATAIAMVNEEGAFNDAARRIFLPDGKPPRAGTMLANPQLARALEAIGSAGRAGFYEGEVARALARFAHDQRGFFTEHDLARQSAGWGESISGRYRDVTIHETPAPTQGFTVLQMLALLEPFELGKRAFLGPDHVHLAVQAKQIAYHDRDRHLGDPGAMRVPIGRLLAREYIDARRSLVDPAHALAWDRVPSYGSLAGDTVYMAAVDEQGNAVSLIQSLYGYFGSGAVAGDTGIVLQNRAAYFTLDAAHPNALAPGKKPLHTLIASLAYRDGKLWQVLGCMGADGQPQIHVQTYLAMIDFGLDIQQAVEAPRWLSGRFSLLEPRDLLNIEGRIAEATLSELERRGHRVNRWPAWHELAGHCHGITIDPVNGVRAGGADPRSDGAAIGY